MKIVAFGASTSSSSINKQFAAYTARQIQQENIEVLDLNDFPLPLFSVDVEKENGIPESAKAFYEKIKSADILIASMAEHNGSYTAAFKNLLDWTSRLEPNLFKESKMVLLSTSPGGRGGQSVMETALSRFPRHGAEIVGHFSLPNFYDNFDSINGIKNPKITQQYKAFLNTISAALI